MAHGKVWVTGFATSWKKAAKYMADVAQVFFCLYKHLSRCYNYYFYFIKELSLSALDKQGLIFEEDVKLKGKSSIADFTTDEEPWVFSYIAARVICI